MSLNLLRGKVESDDNDAFLFAYQQCGSTWYQPQKLGMTTTYVVVNEPR